MKGYEEFKGYRTRIDYDSRTKSFTVQKLVISEMTALTKEKNSWPANAKKRKGDQCPEAKSAKDLIGTLNKGGGSGSV